MYPTPSAALSAKRRDLAPETDHAFREFSRQVFAAGALDAKPKQGRAEAAVPTASGGTRRGRCMPVPRSRRSWRRSGSARKCARGAHLRIR